MKSPYFHFSWILFLLISCYSNTDSTISGGVSGSKNSYTEVSTAKYKDGTYCADVKYYNPNTGTKSSYTLTVAVENKKVIQLNFPNGGRMDYTNFNGASLDAKGFTFFIDTRGYQYKVQITGLVESCFVNVPMAKQCRGITKAGNRCKNLTDSSNELCWQHQGQ